MLCFAPAYAANPTPAPAPTPTATPPLRGPGGAAEEIEYCGYETINGDLFCDRTYRASGDNLKCNQSILCTNWQKMANPSGFQCIHIKESKCSTRAAPPKGYVEPERIKLCVYANSAQPTLVSCLQTQESMDAEPADCPAICQRLGLTCGTQKKLMSGECKYLGPPPQDLGRSISMLYTWSLRVLGLVVFVMFTYAGVLRFFGGANPDNIQKSKAIMTSAIYGAVLLLASVIILNTINPELTKSSFSLPRVENAPNTSGSSTGDGTITFPVSGGGFGGGGASSSW